MASFRRSNKKEPLSRVPDIRRDGWLGMDHRQKENDSNTGECDEYEGDLDFLSRRNEIPTSAGKV